MANITDQVKVRTELPPKTEKRPMFFNHITSTSFFKPAPCHFYEGVPDQDISLDLQHVMRFDPLFKPFLGSASIHFRCFWVPYRTVYRAWNDYINDTIHAWASGDNPSIPSNDRMLQMKVIQDMFMEKTFGLATRQAIEEGDPDPVFDFVYTDSDSMVSFYIFTEKGRQFLKILNSLGYKVHFNFDESSDYVSLMALLSYARICCDWFYPAEYHNTTLYNRVLAFLETDDPSYLNLSDGMQFLAVDSYALLYDILSICTLSTYDKDYFNMAFDQPSGPNPGLNSEYSIIDPSIPVDHNSIASTSLNGVNTPVLSDGGSPSNSPYGITQTALNILSGLSNFLKRNQLAGSRAIDRFLARFGFTNTPEKFNRSVFVGDKTVPVQIGDVMSHSDTNGASLGEYSGQGFVQDNQISFRFENKSVDYGMLIVVYNVVPQSSFVQGIRRENLNLTRFDHWTGQFDGRMPEAIAQCQLLVSMDSRNDAGAQLLSGHYGYTMRYSWAKCGFDTLAGNFVLPSVGGGADGPLNSWYLSRLIPEDTPGLDLYHSVESRLANDKGQFNRLFYVTDADAPDNMNLIVRVKQTNTDHMLGLYDDYNLMHEDQGEDITIRNQGVTMN